MSAERYLCKEACSKCGKPVYADEGYHGISKDHYSCHADQLKKIDEAMSSIDSILADLGVKKKRKRVREGEGKIAKKCVKLATEAFERETGGKVVSTLVWNQQGSYRGPRWDLAAWGVDFEFVLEGSDKVLRGSIASWSKMTAASKFDVLDLSPSTVPYTYEN